MRIIRGVIREPLFVFLVLAVCLFAIHQAQEGKSKPLDRIVISSETRDAIIRHQSDLKAENLTPAETERALEDFIDEEILLKEAYRLGLNDDPVIRTRLLRKMRYILANEANQPVPSTEELRRYYLVNKEKYRKPDTWDLEQLYFRPERPVPEDFLERINAGENGFLFADEHSRFPNHLSGITLQMIIARLGANVGQAVETGPAGHWTGPLTSPHGQHVIRIMKKKRGVIPAFEQIENYVRKDWFKSEQDRRVREKVVRLRQQYHIENMSGG